jgi:hypothetical protein
VTEPAADAVLLSADERVRIDRLALGIMGMFESSCFSVVDSGAGLLQRSMNCAAWSEMDIALLARLVLRRELLDIRSAATNGECSPLHTISRSCHDDVLLQRSSDALLGLRQWI